MCKRFFLTFIVLILTFGPNVAEGRNESSLLPKPKGQYAIGTQKFFLTDSTRNESFIIRRKYRELYIKMWFPVEVSGELEYEYFLGDYPTEVVSGIFKAVGLDKELVNEIKSTTTNSVKGGLEPLGKDLFPVVIFNPGFYFGMADFYTSMAENLASHGFIVCSINHPYEQPYVEQSGKNAKMKKKKAQLAYLQLYLMENFRKLELETDEQIVAGTRLYLKKLSRFDKTVRRWTADNEAFIDYLHYVCNSDSASALFRRMDISNIGLMGQSIGGAVAGQVCLDNPDRIAAGINLDCFQFGDMIDKPLEVPFMLMETEHYEIWRMGNSVVYRNVADDFYKFTIKGAKHFIYSDAAILDLIEREEQIKMIGDVDGAEANALINSYILAFFSKYLQGNTDDTLFEAVDNEQYKFLKIK